MKKVKLETKLNLNKEVLAKLSKEQMGNLKGGWLTIGSKWWTLGGNCTAGCSNPCNSLKDSCLCTTG